MSKIRWASALAVVAALPVAALADESREQELAQRVQELERRLAGVEEANRGGYFTAASDLEARISELESLAAQDKGGMTSVFKSGLKTESGDKAFSYQFYGRLQNDWTWWDADDDTKLATGEKMNGGTEFRRVRLGANGTLHGNVKFKSEIDFAGGEVEFADVFMELVNCGFGEVRVGHFDEPFGLDRLTSSRFTTFIERNVIAEAFAPQRNTGIMLQGMAAEEMVAWQVGMFRDADGVGNDVDNEKKGEYNLTARVAARPVVQDDGATYLHLGMAYSLRDYSDDEVRFRARPAVHISPRFVDTGTISGATDGSVFGLEAAWVSGPFAIKGEYARAGGNVDGGDDFSFDAFAIEASYWLTGDTNGWSKGKASFDRPKVKKNYGDGDGLGGWQIAAGYDTIDLNDGSYAGGEMDLLRFGVNWYLNPNTRVSLNVVQSDVDDRDISATALVMRFQVDF